MPPQQGQRGANLARLLLDLSAHGFGPFPSKAARKMGESAGYVNVGGLDQ
jgi:hypothetical protein